MGNGVSNQEVEAAPHPRWGWDIGTGGGEMGMRHPSLKWAARQGPVLVGSQLSLAQLGAGKGQGCWAEGVPRPLLGEWTSVQDRITRGKYSSSSQSPQGRPDVPRQPLGG